MNKSRMSQHERQIISRITKIVQYSDIVRANTVTMARVCGNKNCKCAKGEKHVSLYLSRSKQGKQRLTYIPRQLEEKAQWQVDRYLQLRTLIDELLEINWHRLLAEKNA